MTEKPKRNRTKKLRRKPCQRRLTAFETELILNRMWANIAQMEVENEIMRLRNQW